MFCTKCGNKLNQEQKFCTNCGETVLNENIKVSDDFKGQGLSNEGTDNNKFKNKTIIITSIIVIIILAVAAAFFIKGKYSDKSNEENLVENKIDNSEEKPADNKVEVEKDKEDKDQDDIKENKWEMDKSRLEKSPKLKNDYVINTSNITKITFSELNDYTIDEIFVARNEMLARYGYSFTGKENLKKYFQSKSWYKENPEFDGTMPSEIEQVNLEILGSIENLKKAYEKSGDIKVDYVLQSSNKQVESVNRISELTDWELIIARNEIYGRYGLNFSTKEIKNHFLSKSWFKINDEVGNDLALTEVENKNLQLILDEEKKRMNIAFDHDL